MHPGLPTCYELLPKVSRTFALNIRILPGELRPDVTIAYLLFRYADTLEDAPGLTPAERTELFDAFLDRLDGHGPLKLPDRAEIHLLDTSPPGEVELLLAGEVVFSAFESLPGATREIIAAHVSETARGMERIGRERTEGSLFRLETWEDLDEYCYYVAGTIGIMLTRLFANHSSRIDAAAGKRLTALATSFGRGLQLTNILKGIGVDRGEGRVYLPAQALAPHGGSAESLLAPDSRAAVLRVVEDIVPQALHDLDDAMQYTLLLPRREPRIRLFCLWPLFAAVRTLGLVAQGHGVADPVAQPKIPREVLYREMAMSGAQVFWNAGLRRRFERFRRELFPARERGEVWAG